MQLSPNELMKLMDSVKERAVREVTEKCKKEEKPNRCFLKVSVSYVIDHLEEGISSNSYNEVIISDKFKENAVRKVMRDLALRLVPEGVEIRENALRREFEGFAKDENGKEERVLLIHSVRDTIIERIEL